MESDLNNNKEKQDHNYQKTIQIYIWIVYILRITLISSTIKSLRQVEIILLFSGPPCFPSTQDVSYSPAPLSLCSPVSLYQVAGL